LPAWIGLPVVSFIVTSLLLRPVLPFRPSNARFLEILSRNERTLRVLTLATSCYVATAIGANNVANVVGPLSASGVVDVRDGFYLVAPLFGLGAVIFRGPAETMGRKIVPLGLFTAMVANFVTASVLLYASSRGIPQSLVHINAAAVIAVSWRKETSWHLMPLRRLAGIASAWVLTPMIAGALTFLFLKAVD
jgi:PiT family inorganic phosphate transporter